MSELITPYKLGQRYVAVGGSGCRRILDFNGFHVFDCFADDADEILKRINGYEQLQATNQQLVEALELADAALSGSNMNMGHVEKKIKEAITNTKQQELGDE